MGLVNIRSSENKENLSCTDQHILINFDRPMLSSSWAIKGGGFTVCDQVLNMKVTAEQLRPPKEAVDVLDEYCHSHNWSDSIVGLMTSANIKEYVMSASSYKDLVIKTVITCGMGNARRVGDPVGISGRIGLGTINIVCWANRSVSRDAHLEAMSIISEARTTAVIECGIKSPVSNRVATGTGTDCIAFLSPLNDKGIKYSGKHTALGSCIGESVYEALRKSFIKQGMIQD